MKGNGLSSLIFLVFTSSCALPGPRLDTLLEVGGEVPGVELSDVPFFEQSEHQCGPASLAAVLVYAGDAGTTPERLAGEVFIPGREGSIQIEMAAAVRRRGFIPSPVRPELTALLAELRAGRPVLVLQDLGLPWLHRWHYAVVVGFHAERNTMVLRSGTTRRMEMKAPLFARAWEASDNWGFAVLRPGDLPVGADRSEYLLQVAGLEEAGRPRDAEAGYDAALAVWPEEEAALLGRGNAIYRQGEPERAAAAFRALLEKHPGSIAGRNNLAHVLMETGRLEEAKSEIVRAITDARATGYDPGILLGTEDEIRRRSTFSDVPDRP